MVDVADKKAGQTSLSVAPRSRWLELWAVLLILLVMDVGLLALGPLLWAGGKWSVATLKFSLVMAIGVDVLVAIAMWWSLHQRARAGNRPPRV